MIVQRISELCRRLVAVIMLVSAISLTSIQFAQAGGAITWGKATEVVSFDPHFSGDGASWALFFEIYDQLLSTDDNYQLTPGLAESWEQLSSTSYRFHLRKDAKFSNGRSVTADDVIGSLGRLTSPDTPNIWGMQLGEINEMVAEDSHTVRVDLAKPNTAFLSVLAITVTSILPMKELNDGSFDPTKEFLGSGPFMVKEHLQDESWTLVRNPHYYRQGYPLSDELIVRIIPDDSARIAALRDGRVDFATFANPDTPKLLGGIPNVDVVVQNTTNFFRLDVSAIQESSPFTDLRVRQAMHYALDREKISEFVFGGNALVDYPVPVGLGLGVCQNDPFYAMPRKERLKKARALLEEAGAVGAKVGVIGSSVLMIYPLIAQVVQSSLNEAGFDSYVEKIPAADWYQRVFAAETDFHAAVSWYAGYTDPALVLYWWTTQGMAGWASGYTIADERIDEGVPKVRQLPNGPERTAELARLCSIINENSNVLALVNKPDYIGYRSDLIDARFGSNEGYFDMLKYAEEFSSKK